MHDGFVYPAIEVFGQQAVVVDRYHVSKLYRKPLDKLRITRARYYCLHSIQSFLSNNRDRLYNPIG
jgi:hypothetical protein